MHKRTGTALAVAVMLAACGGSDQSTEPQKQALHGKVLAQQVSASAYADVVQKIYIAYFGRPADTGGLANFTAKLASLNAPTDISALAKAYLVDANIRAVVDGFGVSGESAALYPGDTTSFVTAVYQHLLNRAPDADGLKFWVSSIDNGTLGKSLASLSIAAAALSNTTDQGKKDATLIGLKTAIASTFTDRMQDASGAYAGDDAAATARNMLAGLTANGDASALQAVVDAVAADMKSGNQSGKPYPLLLSYMNFVSRGSSQTSTVAGTCTGISNSSLSAPVATTFEAQSALAVTVAETMQFSNCTPSPLTTTYVQYFDTTFTPHGTVTAGAEYAAFANAPQLLPVRVAVGDSGSYGTQTAYTDSSKQTVSGKYELSYAIEADAGAGKTPSAVFNLKTLNYNVANVLQYTRQARYRIAADGVVTPLSVDTLYTNANALHLLTKVQPTALSIVDTAAGNGAVAAAGKTLTVNYTGWLYDAGAAGSRGAQFDSSVGRGPFSFKLGAGMVIGGFEQGFGGMKVGGKRTLVIPASLGYGNAGSGSIPGGAAMVFDVELVGVN